ncbi:MAG TPA: YceI family protein [Mycobacteriales bacterium]|nr:YceI family protein [Mycobacteriales bacterium]
MATTDGIGSSQAGTETTLAEPAAIRRVEFEVDPSASVMLVEARSTVGPIEFATAELSGVGEVAVDEHGGVHFDDAPQAVFQVRVESLTSGNALYDAEMRRRLDARRYPTITVRLLSAHAVGRRWMLETEVSVHRSSRVMRCTADVEAVGADLIRVSGSHVVDMRDFSISVPSVLMLRIYPDVTVRCRVDAVRRS